MKKSETEGFFMILHMKLTIERKTGSDVDDKLCPRYIISLFEFGF